MATLNQSLQCCGPCRLYPACHGYPASTPSQGIKMHVSSTHPRLTQELRSATDLALWAMEVTVQSLGKAMSTLVVQERHLWLSLAEQAKSTEYAFSTLSPPTLDCSATQSRSLAVIGCTEADRGIQHILYHMIHSCVRRLLSSWQRMQSSRSLQPRWCRGFTALTSSHPRKKGGGLRLILDLRVLNRALHGLPFKMLTQRHMIKCTQPQDWFAAIDPHVLILPRHRPFLRFAFEGRAWQYRVLPFGLSLSPHVFTKVVEGVLARLREVGVRILNYLNDWLILAWSQLCDHREQFSQQNSWEQGIEQSTEQLCDHMDVQSCRSGCFIWDVLFSSLDGEPWWSSFCTPAVRLGGEDWRQAQYWC